MKANTNANIGNTYLAPAAHGREARLDQVATSLEEQSLLVQSLNGEQLADYRAYGAGMEADINTVQGYGSQGQGYDPVGDIDQLLAQLQQQQNYHMQMMMLHYMMAMLQMMMEMMGQQGQGQGGPQDGGPGPDGIEETGGPDQTEEADHRMLLTGAVAERDAMTPVRAARILAKYFDLLDTAAGQGKKDNVVDLADLAAVAKNPDLPEELRRAADYVVKNPAIANALDVGNKTDEVDGKFGLKDFESFIKEHEGKEGYDKPVPDKKPVDEVDKKPVDDKDKKPVDETDEKPVDDKDKKPVDEVDEKPVDDKKPVDEVDLPNPNPTPQDAIKAQQDATALFEAMDGMGTDEAVLVKILSNQSNKQIATLKDAYSKTYSRDLVEHVKSETSGHFQEVLLGLLNGNRDESTKVDPNLVQDDAQALAKAGGPGGFFTDDEKLVSIFTTRSKAHLAEVAKVFEHINGKTLRSFIEQQTSGDYEASLLAQLP